MDEFKILEERINETAARIHNQTLDLANSIDGFNASNMYKTYNIRPDGSVYVGDRRIIDPAIIKSIKWLHLHRGAWVNVFLPAYDDIRDEYIACNNRKVQKRIDELIERRKSIDNEIKELESCFINYPQVL